jgi:hypothetical protein
MAVLEAANSTLARIAGGRGPQQMEIMEENQITKEAKK